METLKIRPGVIACPRCAKSACVIQGRFGLRKLLPGPVFRAEFRAAAALESPRSKASRYCGKGIGAAVSSTACLVLFSCASCSSPNAMRRQWRAFNQTRAKEPFFLREGPIVTTLAVVVISLAYIIAVGTVAFP